MPSNDRHHPATFLPAVVWCLHCVCAAQEVQACELVSSLLATPLETWRSMVDATAYFPTVLIAAEPTCSCPKTSTKRNLNMGFSSPFCLISMAIEDNQIRHGVSQLDKIDELLDQCSW